MSAVAFLFAAALAAPPATPAPSGPFVQLDRIAAVVGDDVILESEVKRLVEVRLLPRRADETDAGYRDRVLEERIDELLRESQLRRTGGLEPDPRDVEARLSELVKRVEAERGLSFDAILLRARATKAEVSGWIKRGLTLETYVRERISPTVKLTDAELTAYYEGPFRAEAKGKGLENLPPFAEVADELRELLRERRLNEEIVRWTDSLRQATRIVVYRR